MEIETATTKQKTNVSFRSMIQEELVSRCRRNTNYSLRSFAKSLGIDPSLLSKLLRGEREFTHEMIYRLGQAMDIPLSQLKEVQELQSTKLSLKVPLKKQRKAINHYEINEQIFEPISDWTYFAILEALLIEDIDTSAKGISQSLGLTVSEVNIALENLQRMGRITKNKNGRLVPLNPNQTWVNQKYTTEIRKQLQKQFLKKAIEAIDAVSLDERENASLTLAISSELLPEIKKRIDDFKNELLQFAETFGKYDSVYQVCLAAYPMTQSPQSKKQNKENNTKSNAKNKLKNK